MNGSPGVPPLSIAEAAARKQKGICPDAQGMHCAARAGYIAAILLTHHSMVPRHHMVPRVAHLPHGEWRRNVTMMCGAGIDIGAR
jgi:hypothetical protein